MVEIPARNTFFHHKTLCANYEIYPNNEVTLHWTSKTWKGGYGHAWTFGALHSIYFHLFKEKGWFNFSTCKSDVTCWCNGVASWIESTLRDAELLEGSGYTEVRESVSPACPGHHSSHSCSCMHRQGPCVASWRRDIREKLCALCCIPLLPRVRNYVDWSLNPSCSYSMGERMEYLTWTQVYYMQIRVLA